MLICGGCRSREGKILSATTWNWCCLALAKRCIQFNTHHKIGVVGRQGREAGLGAALDRPRGELAVRIRQLNAAAGQLSLLLPLPLLLLFEAALKEDLRK
jgi:hypothetical protein